MVKRFNSNFYVMIFNNVKLSLPTYTQNPVKLFVQYVC